MSEKYTLIIDTSNANIIVAVVSDIHITKSITNIPRGSSERIIGLVDGILKKAKITLQDVSVICCVTGPGSFTGIRVGVTVTKAFAEIINAKILPVTSFEVLTYKSAIGGAVAAVYSNGNFYYNTKNGFGTLESLLGENVVLHNKTKYFNNLVEIAKTKTEYVDANTLAPFYVKLSQAEENAAKGSK